VKVWGGVRRGECDARRGALFRRNNSQCSILFFALGSVESSSKGNHVTLKST